MSAITASCRNNSPDRVVREYSGDETEIVEYCRLADGSEERSVVRGWTRSRMDPFRNVARTDTPPSERIWTRREVLNGQTFTFQYRNRGSIIERRRLFYNSAGEHYTDWEPAAGQ